MNNNNLTRAVQPIMTGVVALAVIASYIILQLAHRNVDGFGDAALIVVGFYFGGHVAAVGGSVAATTAEVTSTPTPANGTHVDAAQGSTVAVTPPSAEPTT